ncbi:MAG: exosortase/archaeosortase family protein [Acidobacteriota bacterium]
MASEQIADGAQIASGAIPESPDAPQNVALSAPIPASSINWAAVGWFAVLLIAVYFPILRKLFDQWMTDDDVTHGVLVPPVALFIAWQRRDKIMAIAWKPAWWGLALLVWGAAQAYLGVVGAELFLQRTAFLISLVGMLLVMGGTKLVKELAFPLCLLPFMIPLPTVIYNKITFPLQLFASRVAETTLDTVGIPVFRDGNILELANQKLSVAEACSGIRSLLSLTFMSLVYAYVFDRRIWMRWVLLGCTIPIAIIANAGRVAITGILASYNPDLAEGLFHEMEGFVIFAIACVMLITIHALFRWVTSIRTMEEPNFD